MFATVNTKQNLTLQQKRSRAAVDYSSCICKSGGEAARGSLPALSPQSDQVISIMGSAYGVQERAPDPGLKQQASSVKLQASSFRTNLSKHQATSVKPFAASFKRQATSCKLPDPGTTVHGYWRTFRGARTKGLC